jgi:diguanylate cyclase (GGDEF)-like protein/PAS domain S-box-containing protein
MTVHREPDASSPAPEAFWERYRLIPEGSSDVVYETDRDGRIQWISPSVQDLLGWEPEDLQGQAARELVHPMDRDRVNAVRASVYAEGHVHDQVPCMMRTSVGSYRAVTVRAQPRLDPEGRITGAIITLSDSHDRDSALRALATLSQANRILVRATDELTLLQQMCDTLVETGRYAMSWYGRPVDDDVQSVVPVARAGDHLGYVDEIRVSWGDNPLGRGPSGRSLRTGTTQVENDFAPDPEYQPWLGAATRHGFKSSICLPVFVDDAVDGTLMVYAAEAGTFDTLAQGLLEDLAADLGYGIARLRDTDRLRATTEMEARHLERLQSTLDAMIDPFVQLDAVRDDSGALVDLVYADANPAAIAYNDIPRERLIGARLLELFPGQLENGPLRQYFATIETGEPVILDDYAYGHEILGQERRYDIRAARSGDGIALTWRDVTDRHVAAKRLADSEHRYRLLAENASDVVLQSTPDSAITWASASALTTLGWDPADLLGHRAFEFIHPDDLAILEDAVERSNLTGEDVRPRYRWRRPDGGYRWMEAVGRRIEFEDGSMGRIVSLRDVHDQVRAEHELAAREERYRMLAENASDIVWQVSPDGLLDWASPSVERVLGWRPDEVVGRPSRDLIAEADQDRMTRVREEVISGRTTQTEMRCLRSDGTTIWMSIMTHPVPSERGVIRVSSLRDIQDEVEARTQLEYSLGHDALTGLATRDVMLTRIDYLAAQLARRRSMAVLCIGIDALSEVNEALTHAAGDIVLTTIAARVVEAAGGADAVGRGSGDELIVIVTDLTSATAASDVAERVRERAFGPVSIAGQVVTPTVSIGIATGGPHADAEQLLRDATLALRKAKNNGRNRCEFADPTLAVEAQHRLALEARIRDGLRDGEFVPWFQPIVDLDTSTLAGYEALVRWEHADGTLEPASFLAVAEQTPLINELDVAVLQRSLAVLARLPGSQFVSVNVTASTLTRLPYADIVRQSLEETGADPGRLHLEVTETMLLDLTDALLEPMHELAALGVSWYVDDFGTGYSSISHLRDLPVAGLKLDQSFTSGIGAGDSTSMQLAQALAGLSGGLRLDTVAEGIETEVEEAFLRALGWRHGQGWLYGKAAPIP